MTPGKYLQNIGKLEIMKTRKYYYFRKKNQLITTINNYARDLEKKLMLHFHIHS